MSDCSTVRLPDCLACLVSGVLWFCGSVFCVSCFVCCPALALPSSLPAYTTCVAQRLAQRVILAARHASVLRFRQGHTQRQDAAPGADQWWLQEFEIPSGGRGGDRTITTLRSVGVERQITCISFYMCCVFYGRESPNRLLYSFLSSLLPPSTHSPTRTWPVCSFSRPLPCPNNRAALVAGIAGTPSHVCVLAAIPFTRFKIWHYPPAHPSNRRPVSCAAGHLACLD